jgi:uncharacterized protein YodC (DUF2158 family)
MAASFKIGDTVKVNTTIPQGPVTALNVNQSGDIQYLVSWIDADNVTQERWFNEDELVGA